MARKVSFVWHYRNDAHGCNSEMPRFHRKSEAALAKAQRAKKTPKRIRRIHAKIANWSAPAASVTRR
jgi:hypothetical protein